MGRNAQGRPEVLKLSCALDSAKSQTALGDERSREGTRKCSACCQRARPTTSSLYQYGQHGHFASPLLSSWYWAGQMSLMGSPLCPPQSASLYATYPSCSSHSYHRDLHNFHLFQQSLLKASQLEGLPSRSEVLTHLFGTAVCYLTWVDIALLRT